MEVPGINPLKQHLAVGSRVLVSGASAGWRGDFHGAIASGPEAVETVQGPDYFYWVEFETPQHDLSEDGPYYKAQILGRYLTPAI